MVSCFTKSIQRIPHRQGHMYIYIGRDLSLSLSLSFSLSLSLYIYVAIYSRSGTRMRMKIDRLGLPDHGYGLTKSKVALGRSVRYRRSLVISVLTETDKILTLSRSGEAGLSIGFKGKILKMSRSGEANLSTAGKNARC